MTDFHKILQIRWSDLDPNFHVRHSVYYDWGAYCRIEFFNEYGLSDKAMMEHKVGPILFREESIFKREIRMNDTIQITLHMLKARKDYSRWTIQHHLMKENDVAAIITVDGAWLDIEKRKLTTPPEIVFSVLSQMPKSEHFQWL